MANMKWPNVNSYSEILTYSNAVSSYKFDVIQPNISTVGYTTESFENQTDTAGLRWNLNLGIIPVISLRLFFGPDRCAKSGPTLNKNVQFLSASKFYGHNGDGKSESHLISVEDHVKPHIHTNSDSQNNNKQK